MENIKQHFLDMPTLQECWYNDEGGMIHYAHPLYPNHISREEALNTGDVAEVVTDPVEPVIETQEPEKQSSNKDKNKK